MSSARAQKSMFDRIRLMVSRGTVAGVDSGAGVQLLQLDLLADEVQDGAEHLQQYGFTSHPHAGAEAAVVFAGGVRSHALVVAVDDRRFRLKTLRPGEVALYDDLGQVVHLTRDGIVIRSTVSVTIEAPAVVVEADSIALGEGGKAVARVGDNVNLTTGKIISGSTKVSAA